MSSAHGHQTQADVWLRSLLRQLAARALDDLARMGRHDSSAVHYLRVRMKKLRAVLRLGRTGENTGELRSLDRHCRAIKNGYGGMRDNDVMDRLCQKHFGEALPDSAQVHATDWSQERGRRELLALACELEDMPLAGLDWQRVLENYRQAWRSARKAMRRCEDSRAPRAFHTWRKRVKRLYYQCLALRRQLGGDKRIRRARKLGRRLGREHDLAMLCELLPREGRWQERARQVEQKRLKQHPRLLKLGRKLFKRRLRPKGSHQNPG